MHGQQNIKKNYQHVGKFPEVIRSNRRLTVQEVTDRAGISKISFHEILTENLDILRVTAKVAPRLLSDKQKQNLLEVTKGFFYRANINENFLGTSLPVTRHGLTLTLLTWRIWWFPNNASSWKIGFNSALKGLMDMMSKRKV